MAATFSDEVVHEIGAVLNDPSQSLASRFRALFTLRNIEGEAPITEISKCFTDSSSLLKHELAYCLGQKQDKRAIKVLSDVLKDKTQEAMVRHEAGEALGAIGDPSSIPLLESALDDPHPEVHETCRLAIDRIRWSSEEKREFPSVYKSVDPAPPEPEEEQASGQWEANLLNAELPLFRRYRAMFSLRNRGGEASVLALARGFGDQSALFKHEIAYVLGQMRHPAAVQALVDTLADRSESPMVRHECAEALGSIATPHCLEVLRAHAGDGERVVRESCIIALDMYQHETSSAFQYADTAGSVAVVQPTPPSSTAASS